MAMVLSGASVVPPTTVRVPRPHFDTFPNVQKALARPWSKGEAGLAIPSGSSCKGRFLSVLEGWVSMVFCPVLLKRRFVQQYCLDLFRTFNMAALCFDNAPPKGRGVESVCVRV